MATDDLLTDFAPAPERAAMFAACMDNYGVGDDSAAWPNNMIARDAVVYGSGVIARRGVPVRHAVDPAELARCQRLAGSVAAVMGATPVGMGSEGGDSFEPFFSAANADEPPSTVIDAALIRRKFGESLFPPATIRVEPLTEAGAWWADVEADGADSEPDDLLPWRAMIAWFAAQPDFVATAFVRIGSQQEFWELDPDQLPTGTEAPPCVFPQLPLGLTRGGSLVGLFGVIVQT